MAEKKLKKLSKKRTTASAAKSTAKSVMDSASQIWLAGLGAFAKAQEEGSKIFDALVREGKQLESKTRSATSVKVNEVKGAVEGTVGQVQSQVARSWDKLEKVFEERVARALAALGVPSAQDIQQLNAQVEALRQAVDTLGDAKGTTSAGKKTPGKKTAAKASD